MVTAPSWRFYCRVAFISRSAPNNKPMENRNILVRTIIVEGRRCEAALAFTGGPGGDCREFPVLAKQFPFWPQKIPGFPTINLT
jgi:hypothetical protein